MNIRVSMLSVFIIVGTKVRVDSNTDGNHTRFVGIGARVWSMVMIRIRADMLVSVR